MTLRTIFHVDMDAFFASVELIKNPALKGKPVIVGGHPNQRGVVATCSYEARAFGVRSAMALSEAKKRCPHAIFLNCDFTAYKSYSEKIISIFHRLTTKVEVVSIDEAYLDVTDLIEKYGDAHTLGVLLQRVIRRETELPCSIGIAANKLVAKMASSLAKPNGIRLVSPGEEPQFLSPLPIQSIPGIGEKTQEAFNSEGIQFIADLQALSLDELLQHYGARGYHYFHAANGHDTRPVEWIEQLPKSVGAETTFESDQNDKSVLLAALDELTEQACKRLSRHKMRTRGICLKLRDSTFKTITRSRALFADTQDLATLQHEIKELFLENYQGAFLRLIGVSLHNLAHEYWQPTLWNWEIKK